MADVAGWGSALVTFCLIQGAFYLKAYWGHFGLDPFQFVAVSELALAGLTGIGMVLFLLLLASLFGGWVETKVTSGGSKSRPQAVHDPAAGGLSLSYGYDPVGSITELKNGAGSEVLAKYAYDSLGRLTQTQDGTTGTPIETYGYDATGNRTALTTSAGTINYTYPTTSHRLTAVDGEARNHDAVGNTTSIGSKAFTYNHANRMNAVKQDGAVLESYAYNHRGERVVRSPAGGAARRRSRYTTKQDNGWATTRTRARRSSRRSGWTTIRWR